MGALSKRDHLGHRPDRFLASNEEALFDKVHPSLHPSLALPSAVRRARPRGQSSDERGPKSESADGRLEKAKFFLAFSSCCSKNNKQVFIPYKKLTIIGWLYCVKFLKWLNSELCEYQRWFCKEILQIGAADGEFTSPFMKKNLRLTNRNTRINII